MHMSLCCVCIDCCVYVCLQLHFTVCLNSVLKVGCVTHPVAMVTSGVGVWRNKIRTRTTFNSSVMKETNTMTWFNTITIKCPTVFKKHFPDSRLNHRPASSCKWADDRWYSTLFMTNWHFLLLNEQTGSINNVSVFIHYHTKSFWNKLHEGNWSVTSALYSQFTIWCSDPDQSSWDTEAVADAAVLLVLIVLEYCAVIGCDWQHPHLHNEAAICTEKEKENPEIMFLENK